MADWGFHRDLSFALKWICMNRSKTQGMGAIAIVFESFVRAGSQRHLLEIIKGVSLFKPEISCTLFLIAPINQGWPTFLPEIEQAGISVFHFPYVFDRLDQSSPRARLHNWWSRRYRERSLNAAFYSQLAEYDAVVCAQPFVVDLLLPHIHASQRLCFHLMEHLAQRASSSYQRLLCHQRVHLIYMHASQVVQLPHLRNPNPTITWPVRLCPDHLHDPYSPNQQEGTDTLCIAHYSRISPMRLIDQVIDAFALLHQRTSASLRIVGFIEDSAYHKELIDQIQRLGLTDSLQFVDPVPSPADDPDRLDVDLVWMISLSGHIGYAGLETIALGLPTLFLEVDTQAHLSPSDPQLSDLICLTHEQLVERSLALQADRASFLAEQAQLVRDRFITTKEAIDELTSFYLGQV